MENKVNKIFVKVPAKEAVDAGIKNGDLSEESLIFIEEQGRECLHTQGKDYQMVPSGGKDGQILISHEGHGEWKYFNDLDSLTYGVEWDINVADPTLTRVGNMYYHQTLPIQSQMKGCILNVAKNKVVYWLNENDWRFRDDKEIPSIENVLINEDNTLTLVNISDDFINKYRRYFYKGNYIRLTKRDISTEEVFGTVANLNKDNSTGNFIVTVDWPSKYTDGTFPLYALSGGKIDLGSNLSGYDGEVMVYVPEFYIRSWEIGNKRRVSISSVNIDGSWEHQPAVFISAYQNTLLREVPNDMGYLSSLKVGDPISVVNSSPYCRGGVVIPGGPSFDDSSELTSTLNKPATKFSQKSAFDTISYKITNNRGSLMTYSQYKNIMCWLPIIEYGTFNLKNKEDGGLSSGITNFKNWYLFFKRNSFPICPNGYTNSLGNKSGEIPLIVPEFTVYDDSSGDELTQPSQILYPFRWRGIENPYGHLAETIYQIYPISNQGEPLYSVYSSDEEYLTSIDDVLENGTYLGEAGGSGYIKELKIGNEAHILATADAESSPNKYMCSIIKTISSTDGLRSFFLGGDSGEYYIANALTTSGTGNMDVKVSACGIRPVYKTQ